MKIMVDASEKGKGLGKKERFVDVERVDDEKCPGCGNEIDILRVVDGKGSKLFWCDCGCRWVYRDD